MNLPPTPRVPIPRTSPASTRRNVTRRLVLAASAMSLAFLLGCANEPGTYRRVDTTKYTLENTDRVALLDSATRHDVSCTGLQDHLLADGRMEVVANLKNRGGRPLKVEASCLFTNDDLTTPGRETPWQTVNLAENTTEAVRFTAPIAGATRYRIRIREPL
ncbi:MAG TPA: YcfL family protein [Opitutaceae bacterium]|nr:YcfL family protein [Opitutaceae bacterium]